MAPRSPSSSRRYCPGRESGETLVGRGDSKLVMPGRPGRPGRTRARAVAGPCGRGRASGPQVLAEVAAEAAERAGSGQRLGGGALELDTAGEVADARIRPFAWRSVTIWSATA